ncbi:SIS domain-containing protein [Celeribacter sp.]|uniref:SIS domain-containing protein n=1 Tax=Celeribacter sp. TaxID=1890673 RepID=UPI003A9004B0
MNTSEFGALMRSEAAESADVLRRTLGTRPLEPLLTPRPRAIYSIARGSSDAAATVLNYEFMRVLKVPATTLPPSVFSVGDGVEFHDSTAIAISQSGASGDLVAAAKGAATSGAQVIAITNVAGSPVEAQAHHRIAINAGPEKAVPATKSVVGAIAAGMALIASADADYARSIDAILPTLDASTPPTSIEAADLPAKIAASKHIFVVGRQATFGAAQEVALKIKECCGIHAEAYSASEIIHGPMQLAGPDLLTIILDDETPALAGSLDLAHDRFESAGSTVVRLSLEHATPLPQALSAAFFLIHLYPQILEAALALGINPDSPSLLAKVTQTL